MTTLDNSSQAQKYPTKKFALDEAVWLCLVVHFPLPTRMLESRFFLFDSKVPSDCSSYFPYCFDVLTALGMLGKEVTAVMNSVLGGTSYFQPAGELSSSQHWLLAQLVCLDSRIVAVSPLK